MSDAKVIDSVPTHDVNASRYKDSQLRAVAGTVIQIAGWWSIVLGVEVHSDTDYLEGIVARILFFLCCAVLVVGGLRYWRIGSLHLALRVLAILFVFAAASMAAWGVIDQQLFIPGIMLVIVALAYRLTGNAYVMLVSVILLTGFAAFRVIDDVVIQGSGVGESFISVLAILLNLVALGFTVLLLRRGPSQASARSTA